MQNYFRLLKNVHISKIMFIALLASAESISFTNKVTKISSDPASCVVSSTPSQKTDDKMVNFLTMLKASLEAIELSEYFHLDTTNMNTSQLIACNGYKAEEHTVISNGYILKMFRIPGCGPSVLLMHGLTGTSNEWLVVGDKSLAIILADLGYDVWLGNARGNTYSRKHTSLSPKDPKFWDFSFHEIGTEDLPSCIDHICEIAEVPMISYVGNSQGTTSMSVLLSEKPEYNNKLLGVVFLSAVTYCSNMKSPVMRLLSEMWTEMEAVFKIHHFYEILPHRPPFSTLTAICASSKQFSTLCLTLLYSLVGFNYDQIDYHYVQGQFRSVPGGASLKQLIHYLQIINCDFFQKYDYGKEGNMEIYGSDQPPSYELENITTNVTIFYSNNDWLSNFEKDVSRMIARLPKSPEVFKVEHKMWNHIDFIWGKDVDSLVYYLVEKMLRESSC